VFTLTIIFHSHYTGLPLATIIPVQLSIPSMCTNCLNKITPQDEQAILDSKAPVSQSDLPSDQQAAPSQSESSPNPSNPTEQSPPSENAPSSETGSGGGGGGSNGAGSEGGDGEGFSCTCTCGRSIKISNCPTLLSLTWKLQKKCKKKV
jgi:hypothetical protein